MPGTLGEYNVASGAGSYGILAVPHTARWRTAGGTIDWSTVPVAGGTNAKGNITVTVGSGTFDFTVGGQTASIAYNATADAVEAAIEGLSSVGNGNVRITGTAPNFAYEFIDGKAKTAMVVSGTGATYTPTQAGTADANVTLKSGRVVKAGDKYLEAGDTLYLLGGGKIGLAVTGTTLNRGETWLLDKEVVYSDQGSELTGNLLEGGNVWKARIRAGGAGQPTLANILAALPMITFTEGN
ncbi:MAG: hypothetical protein ACO1SV_21550 [Fimbriimonas sp.]